MWGPFKFNNKVGVEDGEVLWWGAGGGGGGPFTGKQKINNNNPSRTHQWPCISMDILPP